MVPDVEPRSLNAINSVRTVPIELIGTGRVLAVPTVYQEE